MQIQEPKSRKSQERVIAIAATFTAEPIEAALSFWMQKLEIPLAIKFTEYNQVFQQLLDPASLIAKNKQGINIILVRFEDWQGFESAVDLENDVLSSICDKIERNIRDLLVALKSAAVNGTTPYLIYVCPASPAIAADPIATFFKQMENLMVSELAQISNIYLTTSAQLSTLYPVPDYYDFQADKLGHIPYTPMFFGAIGSSIARKVYAIATTPYKVIVLDCDNTIWKGIVGEDGVMNIEISPPWAELQKFMIAQQSAGKLLCLCSKNNEVDVLEVFERRSDMPLKLEQIVSRRINWLPKSENIKSLAQELNLGLDSFIFIDDNPVECAEVQASCPEVLTLQLPISQNITQFLDRVWAFDLFQTSAEDKQRTSLYQQNVKRNTLQQQSLTIEDFLTGLELKIDISKLDRNHLLRVSQLTQRTNQFNFTTIRRSESEIQELARTGLECHIIEVRDRFGDYGLVGVVIFSANRDCLEIDSLLLSCRVLGRGVEHRIFNHLASIAKDRNLLFINALYLATAKNLPALNFLKSIGGIEQAIEHGYRFSISVEIADRLVYQPSVQTALAPKDRASTNTTTNLMTPQSKQSQILSQIATELSTPTQILAAIETNQRSISQQLDRPIVAPRNEIEQRLAQIWSELLYVESIGIEDNFFDLGGTSLLAVRLFAQIERAFSQNLSIATLLEAPTLEQLANVLQRDKAKGSWCSLVPVQPQGKKSPLFCIHALGGNILIYRHLATNLGVNRPIYGLQSCGLDGKQMPLNRVEDMAATYIQEIQAFQPEGPYFLAGYSLGGLIAFEIAQQLHRKGARVALVTLIDTYARELVSEIQSSSDRTLSEKLALHLGNLFSAHSKQHLDYLFEQMWAKSQAVLIQHIYIRFQLPLPYQLRVKAIELVNQQASLAYMPQVYTGGRVALLRATQLSDYPDLGWSELVEDKLEIYDIPGKHNEIDTEGLLTEPHVRIAAEKLKICLERT
jgi:FkbH-like protein